MEKKIQDFMLEVKQKNPNEIEFLQAVEEVAEAVIPFMEKTPKYNNKMILGFIGIGKISSSVDTLPLRDLI